jgi:hypothetical protein
VHIVFIGGRRHVPFLFAAIPKIAHSRAAAPFLRGDDPVDQTVLI